jgi:hypothetical protein
MHSQASGAFGDSCRLHWQLACYRINSASFTCVMTGHLLSAVASCCCLLQGDRAGLSKLLDASMAAGKHNVAFLCLFLLGQVRSGDVTSTMSSGRGDECNVYGSVFGTTLDVTCCSCHCTGSAARHSCAMLGVLAGQYHLLHTITADMMLFLVMLCLAVGLQVECCVSLLSQVGPGCLGCLCFA